ncbi:MAG TPA: molybdopterin-dependent oxidoreductase [Geminicoccaceae bacterium]
MWYRQRFLLLTGLLALCVARAPMMSVATESLAPPSGQVVLTVAGAIAKTNAPGRAEFDLDMLERLGLSSLTTWTPWTEGELEFQGVSARQLMNAVDARGTQVRAVALNGYEYTIPLEDFDRYDVLLATRVNGQLMRVRDKGPIWIVYPWSGHPELDDFGTREKSVWQLSALHVR